MRLLGLLAVGMLFGVGSLAQKIETMSFNGTFYLYEDGSSNDTVQTKVGIDIAYKNNKGLVIVHGIDSLGEDTLYTFSGLEAESLLNSAESQAIYDSMHYTIHNFYKIDLGYGQKFAQCYVNYDRLLNAYTVSLRKGDTLYSILTDDASWLNWEHPVLHERNFDIDGFQVYSKDDDGFKLTGTSVLSGHIYFTDVEVGILLGNNSEKVEVLYKSHQENVAMYIGEEQEFRVAQFPEEIVYLSQLKDGVYHKMYVFQLAKE